MAATKGRPVALWAGALGVVVLVATGFALKDRIREAYEVWKWENVPADLRMRRAVAAANMKAIHDCALQLRAEWGRWPVDIEEMINVIDRQEEAIAAFVDPPKDPWRNPYVYLPEGDNVLVKCLGSDGEEGGEGSAADFVWRDPTPPDDRPTAVPYAVNSPR